MKPVVSALIITYNQEHFIGPAIESILEQETSFEFEIVIADDCSTDRTGEIVRGYAKRYPERIRTVFQPVNLGIKGNEKAAVEACKGELIAFCEGDDFWCAKDKLETQVAQISALANCDLVHSNVFFQTSDGRRRLAYPPSELDGVEEPTLTLCERILSNRYGIRTSSVLLRKAPLLRAAAEDPQLYGGKGWGFTDTPKWLLFAKRTRISYISRGLAVYRVLENATCRSTDHRKEFEFQRATLAMARYYCKQLGFEERRCQAVEDVTSREALRAAWTHQNIEMLEYMYESLHNKSPSDWLRVRCGRPGLLRTMLAYAMRAKMRLSRSS